MGEYDQVLEEKKVTTEEELSPENQQFLERFNLTPDVLTLTEES